uniref:Retrotransposon protein, putative, unclassified n=1 Tax=Oryza sativa subsp. japonica TaxID=39947 RepID=Q2QWR8_ORYSJ|nr:retrotransposon protein, putative, unclassified [Oryza sativa Japonica Group]
MEREPGGIEPEPVLGRMVAVEDYILCGFLPPPSEFLLLVLNFYGLSLLHLNPNSITFLSIFSHLCEAYIGVELFRDLFRFYYELRWMESNRVSGCVGFRLRDGLKSRYIPFQCPSSRSKWRARWFYLQIENSDPVFVVPEEQPDKISSWPAKPALTPPFSLSSMSSMTSECEGCRSIKSLPTSSVDGSSRSRLEPIQPLTTQGLNSETVEHRIGQVMISGPTTVSNVPVALCEKGAAEREAAINLKEGVAKEAFDVAAAAATTSGGNVLKRGRKFSSMIGNRRKTPTPSVGARGISRKITEARAAAASSANERADRLMHDLAEVRENLQKMRELVAGNERQRQGLEHRMSELENNLSEIRGSLRVTYTSLHQLAGEYGVKTTIPANPDELWLTTSLAELATVMEAILSKHAARIGEETSNGIYTGACHVLACVKLAHPELDLQKILDQGAASDARKDVMEEVGDLGESVLPLFEE